MRFRSGDEGGHNYSGQNPVMFLLHHSWTRLAVWDVAPFCWRIISLSPNVALTQGTNLFFNKFRYICWFALTLSSMWGKSSLRWKLPWPRPEQKQVSVSGTSACHSRGCHSCSLHKSGHIEDNELSGQWIYELTSVFSFGIYSFVY